MRKFLETCPGRCGQIARLIDASLPESLPAISLATAISFCATLRCGRVVSPDGIEPNVFVAVIAETGLGKGQAQAALRDILIQCELEIEIGEPVSDSGLLKALIEKPRSLLIWDEFGIALETLAHSKNSYQATILKETMKLFSMAGKKYIGRQYVERARQDIYAPYLNIFGASTPVRFFDALDNKFVLDGFLARWLTFEEPNNPEGKKQKRSQVVVPEDLKVWIKKTDTWEPSTAGTLAAIISVQKFVCETAYPTFHESAIARADNFIRKAATDFERAFYRRFFEQYSKLCLALSDGLMVDVTDSGEEVAPFAFSLTQHLLERQIANCREKMQHSGKEARSQLSSAIGLQWVSAKELWKRTRYLNLAASERDREIDSLVKNDIWERGSFPLPGSRKKSTHYRRVS